MPSSAIFEATVIEPPTILDMGRHELKPRIERLAGWRSGASLASCGSGGGTGGFGWGIG